MRTKGLGWGLWLLGGGGGASPNEENSMRVGAGVGGEGGEGTQAVGADCPAGGPCGVLYGKN